MLRLCRDCKVQLLHSGRRLPLSCRNLSALFQTEYSSVWVFMKVWKQSFVIAVRRLSQTRRSSLELSFVGEFASDLHRWMFLLASQQHQQQGHSHILLPTALLVPATSLSHFLSGLFKSYIRCPACLTSHTAADNIMNILSCLFRWFFANISIMQPLWLWQS